MKLPTIYPWEMLSSLERAFAGDWVSLMLLSQDSGSVITPTPDAIIQEGGFFILQEGGLSKVLQE